MAEDASTMSQEAQIEAEAIRKELGEVVLEWEIDEYPKYARGTAWFVLATVIGFGLLIYAVVSANFLFALIILMLSLVIYMSQLREPGRIKFFMTPHGIQVGRSYYPYKEMSRFWFIYEPPEVKTLHVDFKNPLRPRVAIDLEDQNPNRVREIIGQFVHEDITEDEEPFSDYIGRIFKI
jgi:hypothetical protein